MSGFSTRAIGAASRAPRVDQAPGSVPIYQTITFAAADAAELGAILTGREPGYAYSRIDNPTSAALGTAIAELEGADAGVVFASGMAAVTAAILSCTSAGDRIVATRAIYGSTRDLLTEILGRFALRTDFVDPTDIDAVDAALAASPARVLYVETIANPTIVVADLARLADVAHRHGALLLVDNTFATPYLCRPLELGADLVIHSASKYLSGHGDVLAGAVAGGTERIAAVRAVQVDTGASLAPFSAFLVLRGLATLALRMERHSGTGLALAAWLASRPEVRRVHYPGLPAHATHEVAARQLRAPGPDGSPRLLGGGMLAFELAGGRAAGEAFIDALRIAERTASLGSVRTIVVHPPSTTHRQLDAAALAAAGIEPGLLRCSVGLEDVDDLLDDFARGLEAARDAEARASAAPAPARSGSA